jgi:hypothetical protein
MFFFCLFIYKRGTPGFYGKKVVTGFSTEKNINSESNVCGGFGFGLGIVTVSYMEK